MLGDFFTKPLQGALFRKFRDVILGYKHIDSMVFTDSEPPVEERVGNDSTGKHESEDPENDGFITVKRKKSRKDRTARMVRFANVRGANRAKCSKEESERKNNVVSRVILSKQSS
jgi:hypothetical protein